MSNNINDLPLFAVAEYTVEENGIKELFHQRVSDGYISATELCKSTGKKFNNWFRLSITQAFLEQLSTETLISVSELVQVIC